jgi:GNAT superfamily N-acetyltransferase
MDIQRLAVDDDTATRAFHEVEQAVARHDRPDAITRTYDALLNTWRNPSDYRRYLPLVAVVDGTVVGGADVGLSLQDNTHVADLEISVLPGHRRRGIGRALHDEATRLRVAAGRTSACGEVYAVPGAGSPGLAFATALGYRSLHEEDHLVLRLPTAPPEVDPAGYELVTWRDRCPDELVEAYCAMRTRMNHDVPVGGLDVEPVEMTVERLRVGEERTGRSYSSIVAAARHREDGELAGYSLVYLGHGTDDAIQDDTLVMPGHRGRHLGAALKAATLEIIQADHPDRRAIHTWTDPENRAMYRTNAAFGYRPVERMHEVEITEGNIVK